MTGAAPAWTGEATRRDGAALALVAGALAERGVREVTLRAGGGPPRALRARESDLPGLLTAALASEGLAVLEAGRPAARIELERGGRVAWVTSDRELADALSSLAAPDRGAPGM